MPKQIQYEYLDSRSLLSSLHHDFFARLIISEWRGVFIMGKSLNKNISFFIFFLFPGSLGISLKRLLAF